MKLVAEYIYKDPEGHPLRCKVRFADPKWFFWQTFDPITDTWFLGAQDSNATLYHLELLAAERPETVYCCEGEKDTDSLIALGLPAVTSGAARTWERHHSEQLKEHGCQTAIALPDHDSKGELHAFDVARHNLAIGIATKLVRLPHLADHEDVSDFIARGGTRDDLLALASCTPWTTLADVPPAKPEKPARKTEATSPYDRKLNGIYFEALKLPKTATGHHMVVCPFHPDAEPSLSLDLDQGVWYCHGCQTGGGVVVFYMKIAKLDGRVVTRSEAWRRLRATYL